MRHVGPSVSTYRCLTVHEAVALAGDYGRKVHELPWLYLDSVGQEFGPLPGWTMREWLSLGRFPVGPELRVRLPEWDRHVTLCQLFPDLQSAFVVPPAWPEVYEDSLRRDLAPTATVEELREKIRESGKMSGPFRKTQQSSESRPSGAPAVPPAHLVTSGSTTHVMSSDHRHQSARSMDSKHSRHIPGPAHKGVSLFAGDALEGFHLADAAQLRNAIQLAETAAAEHAEVLNGKAASKAFGKQAPSQISPSFEDSNPDALLERLLEESRQRMSTSSLQNGAVCSEKVDHAGSHNVEIKVVNGIY